MNEHEYIKECVIKNQLILCCREIGYIQSTRNNNILFKPTQYEKVIKRIDLSEGKMNPAIVWKPNVAVITQQDLPTISMLLEEVEQDIRRARQIYENLYNDDEYL